MARGTKRPAIEILLSLKDRVSSPLRRVHGLLKKDRQAVQDLRDQFSMLTGGLGRVAVKTMALVVALAALFAVGSTKAGAFQTSMLEISTLVDTQVVDMGALNSQIKELSILYGSLPASTAKGFYQTISAGFSDASEAVEVMETSLKLARGGLTDTFTAVDGLTTILNAFELSGKDATAVADSLFVAMAKGKTNIPQLATGLGMVADLAKAAGLSVDEMNAAVATLTGGKASTSQAITGLRGILSAVIKPTTEAQKRAKKLGIEFSTAGIRAMGFANWLADLKDKTKGSDEHLAKLFGDVEGLAAALNLTGPGFSKFNSNMDAMFKKAGAADEAFSKMDVSQTAAWEKAKASLAVAWINAFTPLIPIVTTLGNQLAILTGVIGRFAEQHPVLTKYALYFGLVAMAALTFFAIIVGGVAVLGHFTTFILNGIVGLGQLKNLFWAVGNWGKYFAWITGRVLAPALKVLSGAFGLVGRSMMVLFANPIGIAIAIIAALVVEIYLFIKHFDKIKGFLQKVPNWVIIAVGVLSGVLWAVYAPFALAVKYFDQIKGWFTRMIAWFKTSGARLVHAFIDGIKSAWSGGLDTVKQLLMQITRYLPHSDAKEGPLSRLTEQGRMFSRTFASGVLQGSDDIEDATNKSLTKAAPSRPRRFAVSGGNRVGSISVHFHGGQVSEHEVERALGNVLRRYSYEVG